jgi:hypothetical protein
LASFAFLASEIAGLIIYGAGASNKFPDPSIDLCLLQKWGAKLELLYYRNAILIRVTKKVEELN